MTYNKISNKILIILITFTILLTLFISPISASDIGPTHELQGDDDDGLNVNIEPAEKDEEKLTSDASITFNVSIDAKNSKDTYPYMYPIDIDIIEDDSPIETQTIFLSPTQSENYIPTYEDDRPKYELSEDFQIYLSFDDQQEEDLSEEGNLTRRLSFEFDSRHTDDTESITENYDVDGSTPQGRSSADLTISTTSGFDEPSETTHVDRYRIHESETNKGFLEDFSIPYDSDFTGEIQNFENMRQPGSGSTFISSSSDGFNMLTQTRSIPSEEPQTLTISYNIFNGDEDITVNPVQPDLDSVDSDTEYVLPNDPEDSEYCRTVSESDSVCMFALSNEEISELNNLGELYLEYESEDEDMSAEIFCQGIISGYLSTDSETCGTQGIVDSELIGIDVFEGKQLTDGDLYDYSSQWVSLNFNRQEDGQTRQADVNMRAFSNTNLEEGNSATVEVVLANENNINNGIVEDAVYVEETELTDNRESILDIEKTIYESDIVDTYKLLLCEPGAFGTEDCNTVNNIEKSELHFGTDGSDEPPEINLRSPISIDLDVADSEEIITERRQTQTTDDSLNQNSDWYQLEDETIEDFTGQIEQSVIVESVSDSDASNYEADAEAMLSDISPEGTWDTNNYDSFVSVAERNLRYVPENEDFNLGGWERNSATPERTAQIGIEQQSFDIITGAEFQSVTESERGWYLDRSGESETIENNQQETLTRHTDPDDCYNCLKAEHHDPDSEEITEAEARLSTSTQEIIKSPDGQENWEKVSEEPIVVTMDEEDVDFQKRDADLDEGQSAIYKVDDSEYVVWREGQYEERELYEWRRTSTNNELPFEAPIREEITEWQLENYDIEYVYTGEIQSESDLYTYQKDIEEEIITWEPESVWYDFSNSEPAESSLNQVQVSFTGTSETHYIDWVNNIHTQTPDEIGDELDVICDDNPDISEVSGGTGGVGLIETCNVDGEEVITRIGKEYNQEGTYTPEITIIDDALNRASGSITVYVNEDAGTPEFEVEPINERIDYNVGQIAVEGTISSEISSLNDVYKIEVSPADSFEGTGGCPTNYVQDRNYDVQMQTTTTDLFRQSDDCIHRAFDDTDSAPSEFTRYTIDENNDIIKNDIPQGAIQSCMSSGLSSTADENECQIEESYQNTDQETITYKSGGTYQSIDGNALSRDFCPEGYNLEEVELEDENIAEQYECVISTDIEFSLSSRQISVDYNSIQDGVIQQCSDIVTESETGDHAGYMNVAENGDEHCELVNENDPGPTDFTLYDSENDDYMAPPAGAVRGQELTGDDGLDEVPDESLGNCESFTITEDNNLQCEYNSGFSTTTIQYASITEGSWNYVPQNIDRLDVDLSGTQNVVWESDFIKAGDVNEFVGDGNDAEEDFTITMNPRQIPFDENQIGEEQEFEFTLKSESGNTIQTETIDIQLCSADNIQEEYPRDSQGPQECDGFDTLLSGTDDFDSDRTTFEEAVSAFEEDNSNNTHTITSVKNDICPYSLEYPYGQEDIDGYEVEFGGDMSITEIREELKQEIRHRYAPNNPCLDEGFEFETPAASQNEYTFNTDSFRQPEDVDNIRRIGLTDLQMIHGEGISQSKWSSEKLGDSLRLGTPVISNYQSDRDIDDANEYLVSAYTFDHEGSISGGFDRFDNSMGPSITSKVTDVYSEFLPVADSEIDNFEFDDIDELEEHVNAVQYNPQDIHHSRLAFGTACTDENNQITHEFAGTGTGANCDSDIMTREEAKDAFSGSQFEYPDGAFDDNVDDQAAILPSEPTTDSDTHDFQSDADVEHYSQGLFGGNSLKLDSTSWLMVTPPCINRDYVGLELTEEEGFDDFDPYECTYDGGYSMSYLGEDKPDDRLSTKLRDSNYTISFWVKEESASQPIHPTDTLFSISASSARAPDTIFNTIGGNNPGVLHPQSNQEPYAHSTAELQSIKYPILDDSVNQKIYDETLSIMSQDETSLSAVYQQDEFVGEADLTGDFGSGPSDIGTDDYYRHQASEYEPAEWNHVVITSSFEFDGNLKEPRSFKVYVNGRLQSEENRIHEYREPVEQYHNHQPAPQQFEIDSGYVHTDSVISIGARYLDAGFNQNGVYVPQIESSNGTMYIDDLRIYNESVGGMEEPREFNRYALTDQFQDTIVGSQYDSISNKRGSITSTVQGSDAYNKDIEDVNPLSSLNVEVDYDGEGDFDIYIAPCEDNDSNCHTSASAHINSDDLDDNNVAQTFFDVSELEEDIEPINGMQLHVELSSDNLKESPVINEINVNADELPYQTCQELALNHPSFIGNDFVGSFGEITDNTLTQYEANCDMSTDGGGWTQFYWAEEGGTYNEDEIKEDKHLADCEPDEDTCFTSTEFEVTEYLDAELFPEHMSVDNVEEDTNPQILIKSINGGETDNWAAFELVDVETSEHNDYSEFIETYFNNTHMSGSQAITAQLDENCIHPFASSQDIDSNKCINSLQTDFDDGIRMSSEEQEQFDYIQVDKSQGSVDSITCLGDGNADRCEVYYRVGSSGDYPDDVLNELDD